MAYDFNGTDQNAGNDGGLTGIDVNVCTIAWILSTDTRTGTHTPFNTTAAFVAGGSRAAINILAPDKPPPARPG
jgi:hypothetical protein